MWKGVTDHCDNGDHGALRGQGPWSIVMTGVMGHCDDSGYGAS